MANQEAATVTQGQAPPGYKTQSADTSYEAEQVLFSLYRRLPPWEKIRHIAEDSRFCDELALRNILRRFPDAGEREIRLRLGARRLDRETMIRVYGWDPEGTERPRD